MKQTKYQIWLADFIVAAIEIHENKWDRLTVGFWQEIKKWIEKNPEPIRTEEDLQERWVWDDDPKNAFTAYVLQTKHKKYPYLAFNKEFIVEWYRKKNASIEKPLPEKEYRPHTEPKIEWLGKTIIHKNGGSPQTIKKLSKLFIETKSITCGFDCLFDNYTWEDGSVIGEEVR